MGYAVGYWQYLATRIIKLTNYSWDYTYSSVHPVPGTRLSASYIHTSYYNNIDNITHSLQIRMVWLSTKHTDLTAGVCVFVQLCKNSAVLCLADVLLPIFRTGCCRIQEPQFPAMLFFNSGCGVQSVVISSIHKSVSSTQQSVSSV